MLQTSVPWIYAIGDCIPTPWLAHVASAEGIIAAEHIAGRRPPPLNYDALPSCTYCKPEIASIGLSETEARARGYEVTVGRFPFAANSKASILGQRTGFVKIITESTFDQVLGVHMIGPGVTELIAEGGVALSHEATAESLMRTVHAHPTLYEALAEAAHAAADGAPIHA
jgi:dihydrolipoamide dehydrogenase